MKYLPFILLILLFSCKKENLIDQPSNPDSIEQDCDILNDYGVGVVREQEAVVLNFGVNKIIDGIGKVCFPDSLDFYMSEDNVDFTKTDRISANESSYKIENLENGKAYFLKMVNLHPELDSIVSKTMFIKPGENNLPINTGKILPAGTEAFQISEDQQSVVYKTTSDDWFLTSFANPVAGQRIFGRSFDAKWLDDNSKIAYVKLLKQDNYIRAHQLNIYDTSTNQEENLHTIPNPEDYWIHSIAVGFDGKHIFFKSNKDNGSSTSKEKAVYDNIWKINIETKELTKLSDFLPVDFDLRDFKEDPSNPNNFYVLGGPYNDFSAQRKFDIFHFNTQDQSLTPILEDDFKESYLKINPAGTKILIASSRTGYDELWVYDINSSELTQVTDRHLYGKNNTWYSVDWKDDNTLITYLRYNEVWQLSEFEVK